MTLSGPAVEPAQSPLAKSIFNKEGAHYNIFRFHGIEALRKIFPDGEANDLNFVLFSTSGVHGHYMTIEDCEASLAKYGVREWQKNEHVPDDYCSPEITVLIVHPRLVCLRYGNVAFTADDIPFLKKLRESSWKAVQNIGIEGTE
jgi:hypothetical protein